MYLTSVIDYYSYQLLDASSQVTTIKSIVDNKMRRKESEHGTKKNHFTKKAMEGKNKRTTKQTENNEQSSNKSWPFNNDFKCKCIKPSKWKMLSGLSRLKNKTQRHTLDFMTHIGWKWRGRDRDSMQIVIKRKQSGKREVKPKPSQAT